MRIFLIILLVLVLLIVLLCLTGVAVSVRWWGGEFAWSVKYCGLRLLPRKKAAPSAEEAPPPEKPKKPKKKKPKKDAPSKPSEETPAPAAEESAPSGEAPKPPEKEEESTEKKRKDFPIDKLLKTLQKVSGYADLAGSAVYALPPLFRRLMRGITWYDIETDFLIAGEDAADTAQLYGRVQALLQTVLGGASKTIRVRRKNVRIACDFAEDKCRWDFSCRLRVRVGAVLDAVLSFGWHFLWDYLKGKRKIVNPKI